MITDLKPYPAMKDSGLPWLGEVPERWSLVPNKVMLRRRKTLVGERHTDYQLLSLTKTGVIVRDVSTSRGKFSADMGTFQEVRCGDLVFCLFDVPETPRTIGLSHHKGMITGAYDVFECDDHVLTRFLEAFYIAMDDRKLLSPLYVGLRNTIPTSRFLGVKTPVPPLSEQAAIVSYLDHADKLIARYISAKERLIALLEEQRQAVIQQFITRGLDLTVHLKPSGVEWFGEMPEHWEIRRLAELHIDVTSGTWGEEPTGTGDIACVRVADFDRHHLRAKTENPTMRHVNNQEVARKRLAKGDLLLEKSGGGDLQPVGIVVLFDTDIPAVCTNFVARLRPAQICTSKYALAIHSTLYAMRVNTRSIKQTTGIQNLDLDTYFSEIIPLPPLPDQCAIVARIDQETARIDASIERAQHQMALTKEYRTRLIADVVTGQIDVRNATVELPD